jgi:hypothetical protein
MENLEDGRVARFDRRFTGGEKEASLEEEGEPDAGVAGGKT